MFLTVSEISMALQLEVPISNFKLFFLFLCLFCLNMNSPTKPPIVFAITQTDIDLLSLTAIGSNITGLRSWNSSSHFCQWTGVTCGKRHQRVTELDLSGQKLVGTMSPHIGNLSFLKSIILADNNLVGKIPKEISQLFRLQYLNLSNNSLEGEIPDNLTGCRELRVIDFKMNKLSGNLPPKLGSLAKLRFLVLDKNYFSGEIPSSLGNLSLLTKLSTTENAFSGNVPSSLGKLSSLKTLQLATNHFSGNIPLTIFSISSLQTLILASNNLTGKIPPNIGITLPNIQWLCIAMNNLSGPLPISVANVSTLIRLDFGNNAFTGDVPMDLGVWPDIGEINFSNNFLGRGKDGDLSFITSLKNSTNLKKLVLNSNYFGGVLPNSIANLSTELTMLYLGENQISGVIPEGIHNLVSLIHLGLAVNQFSGSIPSSIGKLQNLGRFLLQGNKLTREIPLSIGNMTQLFHLDLSHNLLEGKIPSSIQGCQNLQELDLSRNNLNSTIPNQVFTISSLSILLNLSQNSLTGPIPPTVGMLTKLRTLDLSGNKLSGEIPSALGLCSSIEELHLENNLLEGRIPPFFISLPVHYLDLSGNKLQGEVPIGGIFRNASSISVDGNPGLCGGVPELQLQMCPHRHTPGKSLAFKVVISISVVLCILLPSLLFVIIYCRRKPKPVALPETSSSGGLSMLYNIISGFSSQKLHLKVSYRDLFDATGGFSPTHFVGSGSFGDVYKGTLKQFNKNVAVKVFKLQEKGASKSFTAECKSLCHIRHRNLVEILTSCSSLDFKGNDFKALVFKFMPNGSLEKWLHHNQEEDVSLNLSQRLNIAMDVACAMNYLHNECHVPVIHRDLKPSNVLLDDNMVAHVSDFGLAKILLLENIEKQTMSTGVMGTIGYAAPEYGVSGIATIQGDVYSYGILLLELFTGKRPTDMKFVDGLNLHELARVALPGSVKEIVDPVLISVNQENENDSSPARYLMEECVTAIIRIGVSCSVQSPGERMNMEEVVKELHAIRERFLCPSAKKMN